MLGPAVMFRLALQPSDTLEARQGLAEPRLMNSLRAKPAIQRWNWRPADSVSSAEAFIGTASSMASPPGDSFLPPLSTEANCRYLAISRYTNNCSIS